MKEERCKFVEETRINKKPLMIYSYEIELLRHC